MTSPGSSGSYRSDIRPSSIIKEETIQATLNFSCEDLKQLVLAESGSGRIVSIRVIGFKDGHIEGEILNQ